MVENPENFVEASEFKYFERFYTKFLIDYTRCLEKYKYYFKNSLNSWYLSDENKNKFINLLLKEYGIDVSKFGRSTKIDINFEKLEW